MKKLSFILAWVMCVLSPVMAASVEESLAPVRNVSAGRIAFCKPSVMDELQIIGEPRKLSKDEAQQIGAIFGSEDSYFEKRPDGTVRGLTSMCMPHWDFKMVLFTSEGTPIVTLRLCTSCRQVSILVDSAGVKVPNIREPAFTELAKLLDVWFPDWAKISYQNKRKWEEDIREKRL